MMTKIDTSTPEGVKKQPSEDIVVLDRRLYDELVTIAYGRAEEEARIARSAKIRWRSRRGVRRKRL